MDLQQELFTVLDALTAAGVDHALCGGFAVAIHGYPRLTQDIDLLIPEGALSGARAALSAVGYTLESGELWFGSGTPRERRVWRVSKADGSDLTTVDLLLVSPFLLEVWRGRETHRIPGRTVTVVSRQGLAEMKRAAGRPRDLEDLRQLGLPTEDPHGP